MQVDAAGTGANFVAGKVATNGEAAPATTGTEKVTASLPAGTTCSGGASGDLCLASFTTSAGFGNCVVVQQGGGAGGNAGAAAGNAATGTLIVSLVQHMFTDRVTGNNGAAAGNANAGNNGAAKNGQNVAAGNNAAAGNANQNGQNAAAGELIPVSVRSKGN
jgi:hypothetical protein